MKTNSNTISEKNVNNGAKAILKATGTLSQTLKQFQGLYGLKLKDTDGHTTETWMSAMGVDRMVTKTGTKKGYAPSDIRKAWHPKMRDDAAGTLSVYRSVCGIYTENGEKYKVYGTENDALLDAKKLCKYALVDVEDGKWSVKRILDGLKQTHQYDKNVKKAQKSEKDWKDVKVVYIRKVENGQVVAKKVAKSDVKF